MVIFHSYVSLPEVINSIQSPVLLGVIPILGKLLLFAGVDSHFDD